jgi:hypothetical protein
VSTMHDNPMALCSTVLQNKIQEFSTILWSTAKCCFTEHWSDEMFNKTKVFLDHMNYTCLCKNVLPSWIPL